MGELRYSITVEGFSPESFVATSAAKARYQCWKAWREAGYGRSLTFLDFLSRTTTLHMGTAPVERTGAMNGRT